MGEYAKLITEQNVEGVAAGIVPVVLAEHEWLEANREGLCNRYATEALAVQSLLNVVTNAPTMDVFAMHNLDNQIVGLGTRVARLKLYDPTDPKGKRKLAGDQIDYWTGSNISEQEHRLLAMSLITQTATSTVLGLLPEGQATRALGITKVMDKVGVPHQVRIAGMRRYGLHKAGTPPMQVYRYHKITQSSK